MNIRDGVFTAPNKGIYWFSVEFTVVQLSSELTASYYYKDFEKESHFELRRNNVRLVDGKAPVGKAGSTHTVVQLDKGARVDVALVSAGKLAPEYYKETILFRGCLLNELK